MVSTVLRFTYLFRFFEGRIGKLLLINAILKFIKASKYMSWMEESTTRAIHNQMFDWSGRTRHKFVSHVIVKVTCYAKSAPALEMILNKMSNISPGATVPIPI
jgi:hypothetical protein